MNITEDLNQSTQPSIKHKVFNNWNVVTVGWYIFCRSTELKINSVKTKVIGEQNICVFRKSDKSLACMDGFCSHMGVDLGIGKVVNDRLQCFFHHWEYSDDGKCSKIPIEGAEISKKSCLTTYSVMEKYGHIWVNPNPAENLPVLDIPEFEDSEIVYSIGKSYLRKCHYHITMINGIDPQHLKTVHNINMNMDIKITQENPRIIDIELKGKTPSTRLSERVTRFILGPDYAYSMKYADGCVAALSVLKGVSFFGLKNVLPTLNMIFAYKPIGRGKTEVTPIFVTKKRKGPLGFLQERFWLGLTKLSLKALQGEDGQVYENIRFNTQNLLPIDAPVGKYIRYINQLETSVWSHDYGK